MKEIDFIKQNTGSDRYNEACQAITFLYPIQWDDSKIPQSMIERAAIDLKLFADGEYVRHKIDTPIVGDAIVRKDGKKSFIGSMYPDGTFQDTYIGSFHIWPTTGKGSYSGGFTMDLFDVKNLKLSDVLTPLNCWIFSGNHFAGGMGVHWTINVKTWIEI